MFIKKRITLISACCLLIFGAGCNNDGGPAATAIAPDSPVIKYPSENLDTLLAGESDTTAIFINGKSVIKGHITANKHHPQYIVPALKGQTLTVLLKPTPKGGNVRINQIQQPGGAFDGPFGDSLSYTFKRDGNLSIIIAENLMAGDPYTGNFILKLFLK
jgi:hypothetical protein